jgi:hypothetical protein
MAAWNSLPTLHIQIKIYESDCLVVGVESMLYYVLIFFRTWLIYDGTQKCNREELKAKQENGVSKQSVISSQLQKKASAPLVHTLQADAYSLAASSWLNGHHLSKHLNLSIYPKNEN